MQKGGFLISYRPCLGWLLAVCMVQSGIAQLVPEEKVTSGELEGFTQEHSRLERGWEDRFRDGISRDNLRESMRRLTAHPHHVGSPYDKDNAQWILERFKEWGFDAKI
jgi:N-acetylated-alpha-linked acidic dipeptidase